MGSETKTLIMYFIDELGKKTSISVDNPKDDLIPEEVQSAMEGLILEKVLLGSEGSELVEASSAHIVTRTVNPLMM